MAAYGQFAPAGFPGMVTRELLTNIEAGIMASIGTAYYGGPVKFSGATGRFTGIAAADTAAVFAGILARQAVHQGAAGAADNAVSPSIDIKAPQSIVKKGYVNVVCSVGTPVKGGQVFMRVTTVALNVVGQLEATADGANSVVLPGVTWATNGKDSANVAEIVIA
jgi:hypothetical protein